jgi:alpha-methylacyl-CoA racemase
VEIVRKALEIHREAVGVGIRQRSRWKSCGKRRESTAKLSRGKSTAKDGVGPVSEVGALEGVVVLDLSTVGPASRASRILADYGARVIKVAAPGGTQIVPPPYAYSGHRRMDRTTVNLKDPAERAAFLDDRVAGADVLTESFRPGVADKLGIGFEALSEVNPGLVYCSTSGYGQTGPRSQWAGHDLNYLATSGFLHCSGRRADGRPALPGATVADIAAGGMQAAMAIMALLRRERTGRGEHLDVSIADGAFAMMSLYADEFLATGVEPGPGHYVLTGRYACYDLYTCSDGRYLSVGAIEPAFWANLCRHLGLDHLIEAQYDDAAQDRVRAELARTFATRPRDEWVAELGPADTCVAPVLTVAEAVIDDHHLARGLVVDAVHPTAGHLRQLAPIWAGTVASEGPEQLPDFGAPP